MFNIRITSLLTTILAFGLSGLACAQPWSVESTTTQVSVVELFTSQGCSSCPPADNWLSDLKMDPKLFEHIIPVAYHVTYWDYLGWKDPFGLVEHDQRHRSLARDAGTGVYTPGLFVQGREWRGWRRQSASAGLSAQQSRREVGVLSADAVDGSVVIRFRPTSDVQLKHPEVLLTFFLADRVTPVTAGENRGSELHHDFIAGAVHTARLHKNGNFWAAAFDLTTPAHSQGVALWIRNGNGAYIQAAGRFLNKAGVE